MEMKKKKENTFWKTFSKLIMAGTLSSVFGFGTLFIWFLFGIPTMMCIGGGMICSAIVMLLFWSCVNANQN